MKKALCILLAVLMILGLFSGCAGEPAPLRICIDLGYLSLSNSTVDLAMYDFESSLENNAGVNNFVVEYIPEEGAERETVIDRLRTEIMSGGGPDVFIMHCAGGETMIPKGEALFLQPEKSMEIGLFLPLDDYIENAQYAEWDKFTPSVMSAGRNAEGQQLIPITYALPAAMYRASDFSHTPSNMTWEEMLSSTELYDSAARLGDGFEMPLVPGSHSLDFHIDYILGKLADYEQEQLAFTEAELLHHVNTVFELQKYTTENGVYDMPYWSEGSLGILYCDSLYGNRYTEQLNGLTTSDALSLVPLYSDDGGCTAMILTYAAVNRNTQRPQDAFTVIDYLLMTNRQQNMKIFLECIYRSGPNTSMSIHEGVCSEAYPVNQIMCISEDNFAAMGSVRNQITHAQFAGQLNLTLQNMMIECWNANQLGEDYTGIVHRAYETMDRMMGE